MAKLDFCSKAEILDNEGSLICTAQVEVGFQDSLFLTVPRSFDHEAQPFYTVVFYDPIFGLFTCKCELYAPLKKPGDLRSFRCRILQEMSKEQRRQDVKVPMNTPVNIVCLGASPRMAGREGDGAEESSPATVRNISAGGVYITSKLRMEVGDHFAFSFYETGDEIPLTALVLRAENKSEDPEKPLYGYGCCFVRLPVHLEAQLRRYIFQQEKLRYRKRG